MKIRVACSPDADDLFMMRALTEGLLDPGPYRFEVGTAPTDALNRMASDPDAPEVCAISIAHLPKVQATYQLLPHGGSMGEGYGPVLIAREPMPVDALRGRRVAVPGLSTSAWITLQLAMPGLIPVEIPIVPPARVFEALRAGEVEAALIIHEGRLTYADEGFHALLDIGEWWDERTGLPLPLGGNTIARRLGPHLAPVSDLLRRSIAHGLAHREDAIDWLLARGGPLRTREAMDRYLAMYANQRTLDYGPVGRAGIQTYLDRAAAAGLLDPVTVDYAP